MNMNVTLNTAQINREVNANVRRCQMVLDAAVLKDSNYYCPMQTSMLIKSGILHTVIGSGRVIWQTPYAREQYYDKPNKSHQYNPNATMRWFETAKSRKLTEWRKLVDAEYHKHS